MFDHILLNSSLKAPSQNLYSRSIVADFQIFLSFFWCLQMAPEFNQKQLGTLLFFGSYGFYKVWNEPSNVTLCFWAASIWLLFHSWSPSWRRVKELLELHWTHQHNNADVLKSWRWGYKQKLWLQKFCCFHINVKFKYYITISKIISFSKDNFYF